jgi:hypothetical protein
MQVKASQIDIYKIVFIYLALLDKALLLAMI